MQKNWKTSLTGAVAALLAWVKAEFPEYERYIDLGVSALIIAFAYLAAGKAPKDN
jgi:hypothetical protein